MKNTLLFVCSIVFSCGNAQNINFPDSLLKGALINSPTVGNSTSFTDQNGNILESIDTDNDGEVSISEAENIRAIDFAYLPFTNLEGLQFFINVRKINSYNSFAQSFDFPELINLEELTLQAISGQQLLTTFDVSGNVNLKVLELNTGLVNSVDLSNNINLRELRLTDTGLDTNLNLDNLTNLRKFSYFGNLNTLDISDCDKLVEVIIGATTGTTINLSSIDFSNQPLLANLYISNTQITNLDLSNSPNLENVYLQSNNLQSINFGGLLYVRNLYCDNNQLTNLDLNNFQNLEILSCGNNNLISLKIKNFTIEDFIDFSGNPNLQYICCDVEQQVFIGNQALLNGNFDVIVNSDCVTNSILSTAGVTSSSKEMFLFPNPTSDLVTIKSSSNLESVSVLDVNGRTIETFRNTSGAIDVSFLNEGIYFLQAIGNGTTQTLKLIKI